MSPPSFEHFSENVAEAFVNMPSHTALPDFLGVTFTEAGPGRLVAEMDVRSDLLTPFGNLHGGVIAVLVDHVLGSVMYPVMPRGWWAATTEYKVNNLAPVRDGRLRAEATIVAMTKRTSVVRIDVTNDGRLVCVAQGTCLLQEPKPPAEGPGSHVPRTEESAVRDVAVRPEVLDLFDRGTAWTSSRVAGVRLNQLREQTPCTQWDVRALLNHLLAGQRMFVSALGGEAQAAPPQGAVPDLVGEDPHAQYDQARHNTIAAFSEPGALERTIPAPGGETIGARLLGIAFADAVVHGWDLAKATGQDETIPPDLADAAWRLINGRIGPQARGPGKPFADEVSVDSDASAQAKLIAYTGRLP